MARRSRYSFLRSWQIDALRRDLGNGGSLLHQGSGVLSNADILASEDGNAVVLVPASEVLDYSGVPTRLPIPVSLWMVSNIQVAYGNVDAAIAIVLFWGSDKSLEIASCVTEELFSQVGTRVYELPNMYRNKWTLTGLVLAPNEPGVDTPIEIKPLGGRINENIYDNGIAARISNGVSGNLILGHVANTVRFCVGYLLLNLSTGLFE